MNHWIVLPILLPAVVAPLLALSVRHDIVLARIFSVGSTVLLLMLSILHLVMVSDGSTHVYALGNWAPPFGIVLVLDRLAATMLVLTATLGLCVQLYAINDWDRRGEHFHPLFQFQLMGLCGAFLTGDLFNLFVFFEVLLIASYGLMAHGGGPARIRAALQYVIVNLVGSTLFLFALALIYSVTGTLNMADLAVAIPNTAPGDQALLFTGAALLLTVFSVKAALFPFHFWLPGTYANAPGPVAALFSIMTKVGAYSILRVFTLMFHDDALTWQAGDWLLPCALGTLVIGMLGVPAARSLGQQVSFMAVASMGTLLTTVAMFSPQAHAAGLYYLVHSTICAAVLFLIVDMVVVRRPGNGDALVLGGPFSHKPLIAGAFFLAAIAAVGMPPLSGFIGKLLVLEGVREQSSWIWVWSLVIGTSLLGIIGFSRSGSLLFWKSFSEEAAVPSSNTETDAPQRGSFALSMVAVGSLLFFLVLLTGFAGPVSRHMLATAEQMHDRQHYIDAVLKRQVVKPKPIKDHKHADEHETHGEHHEQQHGKRAGQSVQTESVTQQAASLGESTFVPVRIEVTASHSQMPEQLRGGLQ